jgi:hypothetical protein
MTSKALNAAMNIQRRIRTLSLQPSERERQKFVKIRRIVANATVNPNGSLVRTLLIFRIFARLTS